MTSISKKLILLCTGLGQVQRGFEMYIASLAAKLGNEPAFRGRVELWAGGSANIPGVTSRRIPNLYRNGKIGKRLGNQSFLWEQRSFAMGMLPLLLKNNNAVYYLGEYQLYCYLFKIRQVLGLNFSLVLYTGGQAIPGLFDARRDFVHHVTDMYLAQCRHIPKDRQVLLPHFIEEDFVYDTSLQQAIRQKAAGKKIVLSVGLVDKATKRMDLLVQALIPLADNVFPVILGQNSQDTAGIRAQLNMHFVEEGFVLDTIAHSQLGNWYTVADLFILCSPKESFGLAMVEALYHDLPVICHDFEEAHCVMQQNARFVSMYSVAKLTNAIHEHLTGYQKKATGRHFVEKYYTWAAVGPQYVSMFQSIQINQSLIKRPIVS